MKNGCPRHLRPGGVERAAVNKSFGQWCSKHFSRHFSNVFVHASFSRGPSQGGHWLSAPCRRAHPSSLGVHRHTEDICNAAWDALDLWTVGVQCGKLPPSSPDLNPIENVWAMLNSRLASTKPTAWESEKAFRVRVRNAVLWLNSSRGAVLKRLISSMPRRVEACVEVKGAMTPY